jgi:hypothetical protein
LKEKFQNSVNNLSGHGTPGTSRFKIVRRMDETEKIVSNNVIDGLKTYKFGLKIVDDLKDYLSCRILTDYERKTTFVMQRHLIDNLKEKFQNSVNNLSDHGTPGTSRF